MLPDSTMTSRAPRALGTNRGFSLMEVLISMLVLAIGLLGLAALQTQGLRASTDSYLRSQGTALAYDIIERMRANRANIATYTGTDLTALDPTTCDPMVLTVAMELTCWVAAMQNALPGVQPAIDVNATSATFVDVSMSWVDREPRDFGGVIRPPANDVECRFPNGDAGLAEIPGRTWDAANSVCLVQQIWTVYP